MYLDVVERREEEGLLDQVVAQHSVGNRAQLVGAELYAASRCAHHEISLVSVASDLNIELHPTNHTAASAALGRGSHSGAGGRTRHVKVQYFSVQGAVEGMEEGKKGTSEGSVAFREVEVAAQHDKYDLDKFKEEYWRPFVSDTGWAVLVQCILKSMECEDLLTLKWSDHVGRQ